MRPKQLAAFLAERIEAAKAGRPVRPVIIVGCT